MKLIHVVGNWMKIFLLVLFLFSLSCTHKPVSSAATSKQLCAIITDDLKYVHHSITSNFSGYAYSEDIRRRVDQEYVEDLAQAQKCQTDIDYERVLKKYISSFHDPHVTGRWAKLTGVRKDLFESTTGKASPKNPPKSQTLATGLQLANYGNQFFIKAIDPKFSNVSEVSVGDELVSCNGKDPLSILNDEILPFIPVSAVEAAQINSTPFIFIRWDQLPNTSVSCNFKSPKGISFTKQLDWKPVSETYYEDTFETPPKDIYRIEKTNYGHWVTLHSLGGYNSETNLQLTRFVEDAKKLRGDKVVVIDLRGNSGGNSSWANSWIENLFGSMKQGPPDKEFIFASAGNIEHFQKMFAQLRATKGTAGNEASWDHLIDVMKSNEGKIAYFSEDDVQKPKNTKATGFKGKVYVVTDSKTFSSGEAFVEMILRSPRVSQAGIATNASTYYSDIRFDVTPGGLVFNFPTKGEIPAPGGRESGAALVPTIPLKYDPSMELHGIDSMRVQLEKWIASGR